MKKISFSLACPGVESLVPAPLPSESGEEFRIPVAGLEVSLKKKAEVVENGLVGACPDKRFECAHSPVTGVVTDVQPGYVAIAPQALESDIPPVQPMDLGALSGQELIDAVKQLGVSLHDIGGRADIVVINALNPEPGICFSRTLLEEHAAEINAGIFLLKRINWIKQISAVLPEGAKADFPEDVRLAYLKPVYPNSRPALVAFAATRRELPANVAVISIHTLWRLGRVALTGLPLTETIISCAGKNWLVKAGTTMRQLLRHAGIEAANGDRVALGGLMRGTAVPDIDQPIPLYAYALSHVPAGSFAPVAEHPCINCGACVRHCPSRLMPNFLGRNAEFSRFEATRDLHVNLCMDCGLCSYFCPARRPMLQYMRLSKKELAAAGKDMINLPMADQ